MKSLSKNFVFLMIIAISILSVSCGKRPNLPEDFPEIYPCEITVIQDKKPLSGALVSLIPQGVASPYAKGCTGKTDESGKASLQTYGQKGVPAGKYKVVISKTRDEGGTETTDSFGTTTQTGQKVYSYVEKKYTQEHTSPYEIDVVEVKMGNVNSISCDVGATIHEFLRNAGN